jgi:hypothetical protein
MSNFLYKHDFIKLFDEMIHQFSINNRIVKHSIHTPIKETYDNHLYAIQDEKMLHKLFDERMKIYRNRYGNNCRNNDHYYLTIDTWMISDVFEGHTMKIFIVSRGPPMLSRL